MWKNALASIWRRTPPFLRRWGTRLSQTKFTVSAGAVVFREDGRVLLLHHRFRPGSGWGIPGGFIGRNETLETALRRELREETGLDLSNIRWLGTRTIGKHLEIIYVVKASGTVELRDLEIISFEWVDPGDLPAWLNQGQRDLIERAVTFVRTSSI